MTFDPTKPVQIRSGRKARIICTNIKGKFPLAVAIIGDEGTEYIGLRCENGQFDARHTGENDLINVPETYWVNVYDKDSFIETVSGFGTREEADARAKAVRARRVACIEITEGEYLE